MDLSYDEALQKFCSGEISNLDFDDIVFLPQEDSSESNICNTRINIIYEILEEIKKMYPDKVPCTYHACHLIFSKLSIDFVCKNTLGIDIPEPKHISKTFSSWEDLLKAYCENEIDESTFYYSAYSTLTVPHPSKRNNEYRLLTLKNIYNTCIDVIKNCFSSGKILDNKTACILLKNYVHKLEKN